VTRDDEVLTPSLTFVATANAIAYCGATPHFADVDLATLAVDAPALDHHLRAIALRKDGGLVNRISGRRIAGLIVMHAFGHPADLDALLDLTARWGLPLIEDAAESLGTTYRGRHTGTFGRVGILSFNGNKIVTTGGGGAILASDPELARRARHLCTTARVAAGGRFVHDEVGYNYRLPSVNAALGLAQLARMPQLLAAKRALAERYAAAFSGCAGVRMFAPAAHTCSNHWLNTLLLDAGHAGCLDAVLATLETDGIHARPAWTPMHALPMYADAPSAELPVTNQLARRIVNLPSSALLAEGRSAPA
jgi:perosamine synthetase